MLSTAAQPENRSYPTVQAASEEIARGMINAMDELANESLPALIGKDKPSDNTDYRLTLTQTFNVLSGTLVSYTRQPSAARVAKPESVSIETAGVGAWLREYDKDLHEEIHK